MAAVFCPLLAKGRYKGAFGGGVLAKAISRLMAKMSAIGPKRTSVCLIKLLNERRCAEKINREFIIGWPATH